ncbi:MAG: hypothetical protein V3U20_10585 [Thermoplasmata archaeon]
MNLEGLCAEWLKSNFDIDAEIKQATTLDQEEIDKALNLVPVECDFTNEKGEDGYTVAFLTVSYKKRKGLRGCNYERFWKD